TLLLFSGAHGTAWVLDELGWLPRLRAVAQAAAVPLGAFTATYTGALFANTAVPVWHEARRELPFVFAAGAGASAGAATLLFAGDDGEPARRVAMWAGLCELAAVELMRRRLGE